MVLFFYECLFVQVRVLFFLVTVTIGIVEGFSDLESSIPVALGFDAEDFNRKSLLRHSQSHSSRSAHVFLCFFVPVKVRPVQEKSFAQTCCKQCC